MASETTYHFSFLADVGVSEFSRLVSGQGRPISHGDRNTIESQLVRRQQQEQHHTKTTPLGLGNRQDLLDADPWENSIPQTTPLKQPSTSSGAENFYSLDLNSSLSSSSVSEKTSMDDSFVSTSRDPLVRGAERGRTSTVHRRCLEGDDSDGMIDLHGGVGLQQLSQSPPYSSPLKQTGTPQASSSLPRKSCNPQPKSGLGPHPSTNCTLTLSGITLALLEADPSHTYTPCLTGELVGGVAGEEASMDEGGLDPGKYFELVSELLKDGVNRHQLALHQEQLAQVLPADHLM